LNQHVEDVAIFEGLRTAGASTELDHGLIAIAEGEAWQLTPAPVAVEETDVPALAEGERHQDLGHGSGSFPWKLGLEGDILPCRESDEACSDAPAADALLECLSLVNGDLEPTQELPNLIQSRVGEVAAKRCPEILLQKLNEPEAAVVARVEIDAMRRATLGAKPLGHWVRRS
jgi:hypothetical protein